MARLASATVLAMLPMPALAAGGWEDAPLQFWLYVVPAIYLVVGVPAAGVGYVLGSFFRLPISILLLAIFALVPTACLWISRGPEQAVQFALVPFVMLLFFGPLIYLGWRFGCRDAIRHVARSGLLGNGN